MFNLLNVLLFKWQNFVPFKHDCNPKLDLGYLGFPRFGLNERRPIRNSCVYLACTKRYS